MTGCDDLRARIFDAHSGRLLQVLEHHTDYIRGVSFSRDGSIVLTASDDNLVRVFNAKTGALYHAMRGHTNSVYALAFSQCCRNACTVDGDGNAIIWDTIKGTEVRRLVNAGDGSLLFCCAWAPNCKAVLIPRGLTSLAEWDPSSGTLLREFDAGGFVLGCSYTSDGRTMAASMKDGPAPCGCGRPRAARCCTSWGPAARRACSALSPSPPTGGRWSRSTGTAAPPCSSSMSHPGR